MSKKRKSSFRGKVRTNTEDQRTRSSEYGYLNLPKGISVFSPEPGGREKFDILPYTITDEKHMDRNDDEGVAQPGDLWYKKPFKMHRGVGVENESVVCLTTFGQKCPICEERSRLRNSEDEDDKELAEALRPSLRNLYAVIPKGSKKFDEDIHIFDISQYLFQNLLNDEIEEDIDKYEVFPDPEEGFSLKVRFNKSQIGRGRPFAEASRIDFYERDYIYEVDVLDDVPNLDEVLKVKSYEKLYEMFHEMSADEAEEDLEEEDQEEEERPRRRKSSLGTRKKQSRRDEQEEDEQEEDEQEEEKKPTRRTRSRAKSKSTSKSTRRSRQEDDEEDDEEDEAEPAGSEDDPCPHGHRFGHDCEKYDDCDHCDKWDDCIEENERLKK